MKEYLTEAEYQRWYRQYEPQVAYYLQQISGLRVRLDKLPEEEVKDVARLLEDIDKNIDTIIPRNFNIHAKPLVGFEKWLENIRVLVNLIFRIKGKEDCYLGIYQEEKDKVLQAYADFKEKLKQVLERIKLVEEKQQEIASI